MEFHCHFVPTSPETVNTCLLILLFFFKQAGPNSITRQNSSWGEGQGLRKLSILP